jgi:branched-chain amino acid transport system ATP-binding protein
MLLELENVTLLYGRIQALHGISLTVGEGEIVALIGANGAGKSTTMRAISGLRPVAQGAIRFEGQDITKLRADLRVVRGVSQSPEGRGIFPGMTVRENLDMGAYTRRNRVEINQDLQRVFTLFPRLKERERQVGGTLSGGEQQMLAVGRALMSRPKLMLLDEPSMGLAPMLIQQIFDIVVEINQQGTTVLLVEQNAQQALSRAHRGYVLETGRIVKSGTGEELLHDPAVKDAYLGVA